MANFHAGWMFSVQFLRALFVIYVNNLPEVCKNSCRIFLYANDVKLYKHVLQNEDHTGLQTAVDSIQEWMRKWLLKLNICKVGNAIVIGNRVQNVEMYSQNRNWKWF